MEYKDYMNMRSWLIEAESCLAQVHSMVKGTMTDGEDREAFLEAVSEAVEAVDECFEHLKRPEEE